MTDGKAVVHEVTSSPEVKISDSQRVIINMNKAAALARKDVTKELQKGLLKKRVERQPAPAVALEKQPSESPPHSGIGLERTRQQLWRGKPKLWRRQKFWEKQSAIGKGGPG